MKANELRIGNLVKKRDEIFEADFITIKMAHNYQPIPITEERLLKFGAERVKLGQFLLDRFQLIWKKSYNYWYVIDQYNACYYSKVEFVHEWQNLYFVLNGEELVVSDAVS